LDLGGSQVRRAQARADHIFQGPQLLRLIWGWHQTMIGQDRADLRLSRALLGRPRPQVAQDLTCLEGVARPAASQHPSSVFGLLSLGGGQVTTGRLPGRQ
jgi:hypothetical protein